MPQLPKIVRDRLAGAPAAVVNSHPDPDLLTAFVEGGIGARERDNVLIHLAVCSDCREVVALAAPELVADQQLVAASAPVKARWWGVSTLRWAAVSATAVIVLGAALLIRPAPKSRNAILLASNTITTRTDMTASLDKSSRADADAKANSENKGLADEKVTVAAAPRQSEVGLVADYESRDKVQATDRKKLQAREEVTTKQPLASPPPNTSMLADNIVAVPRQQSSALAKSAPAPASAAPAKQAGTGYAASASRVAVAGATVAETPRATETVEVAAGAPTINTSTSVRPENIQGKLDQQKVDIAQLKTSKEKKDQLKLANEPASSSQDIAQKPAHGVAAGTGAGVASGTAGAVVGTLAAGGGRPAAELMTTPTSMARVQVPPVRWTIDAAGNLQRSLDLGKSWQTVSVEHGAHLQALAMLQQELWAGGNGGALYHSSDAGAHWTRVRPTAGDTVLGGDITRISLSDPQHLTITTSSSETWTSADGGQTWRKQ